MLYRNKEANEGYIHVCDGVITMKKEILTVGFIEPKEKAVKAVVADKASGKIALLPPQYKWSLVYDEVVGDGYTVLFVDPKELRTELSAFAIAKYFDFEVKK